MSIKIGANLNFRGKDPNFARDQFETLLEMKSISDNAIDEGHISYCKETGLHYEFKSENSIDENTGKWREFKPGGENTHKELTQAEYDALSDEEKNNGTVYFITDATSPGGTANYEELENKPSINNVILEGNKSIEDLKIAKELTQAEYDALSDEEKNNGTVYFITDAEGNSSDGATHIELTQAEYDALSEEKKNNGTVYFITDAEADSIIASNVPLTTLTNSSDINSDAVITYMVKNGMCTVSANTVSSTKMSAGNITLTTGLPIPVNTTCWYSLCTDSNATTAPLQNLLLKIDSSGNLIGYKGTDNINYFGTFSYPVK